MIAIRPPERGTTVGVIMVICPELFNVQPDEIPEPFNSKQTNSLLGLIWHQSNKPVLEGGRFCSNFKVLYTTEKTKAETEQQ